MGSRGYALLSVLWMVAGASALGFALSGAARDTAATVRNRVALTQAEWQADGCLARARAHLTETLRSEQQRWVKTESTSWHRVDRVLAQARFPDACQVHAQAAGSRLDINALSAPRLREAFLILGVAGPTADSVVAAVLDWTDRDDAPRTVGAEAGWYVAERRIPPSNRPFTSIREVLRVRGLDRVPGIEQMFEVEGGPISLNQATEPVLQTISALSPRVRRRIHDLQRGDGITSFRQIARGLGTEEEDRAQRSLPGLVQVAVLDPSAWLLQVTARDPGGRLQVTVSQRFRRAGSTVGIDRREVRVP